MNRYVELITRNSKNNTKKIKGDKLTMRSTKITKPKTTTKPAINLPTSNSNVDTSSQTPIEIALKIDENGMTVASNLYTFLELHLIFQIGAEEILRIINLLLKTRIISRSQ